MDMDFADFLQHCQSHRSRWPEDENVIADEPADESQCAEAFAGTLRETSAGERHDA
jgi:hypothetical protein